MPRLLAFLTLLPLSAFAQAAPATAVPAPLVTALLVRWTENPTYYVDAIPAGWPASLTPPPAARAVGGMRSGHEIMAVFDDTMPSALAAFDSAFEAAGFSHPPTQPMPGFQGMQVRSGWCRDSSFVNATPVSRASGRPYVVVRYISASSTCKVTPLPPRATGALQVPLLQPPPGAKTPGGGFGGGSDEVNAYARLTAPSLTAGQVLEHYSKQLVSAGWKAAASAVSERGALQPFDARDSEGAEWSGALLVVSHGNVRDASLLMRRVTP